MFTGIVQTQAVVAHIDIHPDFRHLRLNVAPQFLQQLEIGASIAINGCCLTVVGFELPDGQGNEPASVEFDVIDETLRLTNLGDLAINDKVNFERSLKVGDEIGGHHVSGHIHCIGRVVERQHDEFNWALWIEFPQAFARFVFSKGFISVNGASLTIGEVKGNRFSLHLIPETLRLTNLEQAIWVNLEFDQQTMTIVETVERVLAQRNPTNG